MMAVLSNPDRAAVSHDFQCDRATGTLAGVAKADILAAVNALDDFMNTNATAVNNAIPQPARTALTTTQKALLLQYVIEKRYIRGA